jgi:hypothetical protein
MGENNTSPSLFIGAALLSLALWVFSILYVRRDTARSGLSLFETRLWLAMTILAPFIGFLAYLFGRILSQMLAAAPAEPPQPRRVTAGRRPADMPAPLDTLTASDLTPGGPLAPPTPARYRLTALEGPLKGRGFAIERLPVRFGRGPEAAFRLDDDPFVSRDHAELYSHQGALRLRDLHSTHGTRVNGVPVSDQPIAPGDHIQLGSTVLILQVEP